MAIEIRRVSDGRAEISLGEELRHKGRLWFVRVPDVTGSLAADWEHRVHAGSPIFRISSLSPFFGGLDYGLPCGIASFREEEARVKVTQYSSPRC